MLLFFSDDSLTLEWLNVYNVQLSSGAYCHGDLAFLTMGSLKVNNV